MWLNAHNPVAFSKSKKLDLVVSESPSSPKSRALSLVKLIGCEEDENSDRAKFLKLWEESPRAVCAKEILRSGLVNLLEI